MASPTDDQKVSTSNITSEYVKLNVGGMLFQTTISTLTKFKENMLAVMFSGRMERTVDKEGYVFIDRSGKHFGVILNFLCNGTVPLPNRNEELAELRAEANYFCIAELVDMCDRALVLPMNIHDIGTNTCMVLTKPLKLSVIEGFTKPVIILEMYKGISTLITHIELFEKIAFNFHEYILFLRYPSNSQLDWVCLWDFYTNGKLLKSIGFVSNVNEIEIRFALKNLLKTLFRK